jgi:hypothetical protein
VAERLATGVEHALTPTGDRAGGAVECIDDLACLDLGLDEPGPGAPLPIASTRTGHLVDALERAYRALGLEDAAGGDQVLRHLVLARIIEPTSKQDSLRALEEAGVATVSYPLKQRSRDDLCHGHAEGRAALSRRGRRPDENRAELVVLAVAVHASPLSSGPRKIGDRLPTRR